ncbi:MAG: antitoxin family protein [Candidatus Schekmanbacteria bacterium]|nr:antitoxin family protein [Candidatus Schekmanbacteria bacterium]
MLKVIDAVYENGVFKPTKKINLKNKKQVQLQIISEDDWLKNFDRILRAIHSKTSKFSPEEIEADIEEAIKEVRKAKRNRESRR